jgi:predicted nucleic acid-binding protein
MTRVPKQQDKYLAFLDAMTLIYALDETADPDRQSRAKAAIEEHQAKGGLFCIPSVALAEFLAKLPSELHDEWMAEVAKVFQVYSFCEEEAKTSAELHQSHFDRLKGVYSKERSAQGGRRALKADIMIVATAIANGGKVIISNDPLVKQLAKGRIEAQDPLPRQPLLDM